MEKHGLSSQIWQTLWIIQTVLFQSYLCANPGRYIPINIHDFMRNYTHEELYTYVYMILDEFFHECFTPVFSRRSETAAFNALTSSESSSHVKWTHEYTHFTWKKKYTNTQTLVPLHYEKGTYILNSGEYNVTRFYRISISARRPGRFKMCFSYVWSVLIWKYWAAGGKMTICIQNILYSEVFFLNRKFSISYKYIRVLYS